MKSTSGSESMLCQSVVSAGQLSHLFIFRSSPSSSSKVPPPPPKRVGSTLSSSNHHNDEIKIYEVEDTPASNLSEKSSFSDLTVDDPAAGSGGRVSIDSNDGLIQHIPDQRYYIS